MTRCCVTIGLTLAALAVAAPAARAQQCAGGACTATNTVSVHVGTILRLAASQVGSGPAAVVRANGPWRLYRTQFTSAPDTAGTDSMTVRLTLVGA